jgi:hypothetical protein
VVQELIDANETFVSPKELWQAFHLRTEEHHFPPYRGTFQRFKTILHTEFGYSLHVAAYRHPQQLDTEEKREYLIRFCSWQHSLPIEISRTKVFFLDECYVARGGKLLLSLLALLISHLEEMLDQRGFGLHVVFTLALSGADETNIEKESQSLEPSVLDSIPLSFLTSQLELQTPTLSSSSAQPSFFPC